MKAIKPSGAGAMLLLIIMVLLTSEVMAGSFYVDYTNPGGTGTQSDPYGSFRDYYNAHGTNGVSDTVFVADGTYGNALEDWSGSGNFDFSSGDVSVFGGYAGLSGGSWDNTRVTRSTIFDLDGAGTNAFFSNDGASMTFDGLTFQDASHSSNGGAIYLNDGGFLNRLLTINDCLFSNNATSGDGGAVFSTAYGDGGSADATQIINSEFIGNSAADGGAIRLGGGHQSRSIRIVNATFSGNTASSSGGAIIAETSATATTRMEVTQSVFRNNTASSGGALAADTTGNTAERFFDVAQSLIVDNSASTGAAAVFDFDSRMRLVNSLIAGNTGGFAIDGKFNRHDTDQSLEVLFSTIADNPGGGIEIDGASWQDGDVDIIDSIIANNGSTGINLDDSSTIADITLDYNDVHGHTTDWANDAYQGSNSINVDPLFNNPTAGDYSLSYGSPALDAGTDLGITTDLNGDLRPQGGGYAMGAYETPTPEPGSSLLLLLGVLAAVGTRPRKRLW